MLVVAEEEALPAEALVAAHHVDAGLLAAAVALRALVQVCAGRGRGERAPRTPGARGTAWDRSAVFHFTSHNPQLEQ